MFEKAHRGRIIAVGVVGVQSLCVEFDLGVAVICEKESCYNQAIYFFRYDIR